MPSQSLMVNSHYPMPWIVWKRTYQINVPKWNYAQKAFPHELPFRPLLIGQWSPNANFSPSYDVSVEVPGGATGGQVETSCLISSDSSNINVVADNNADYDRVYYLRLMAFAPPDYKGEVNLVDYTSAFRYNSHYRYQKLFMQGYSSAQNVQHNLGYLPQAKVWSVVNGRVFPLAGIISTNTLSSSSATDPFYYHIYLDPME